MHILGLLHNLFEKNAQDADTSLVQIMAIPVKFAGLPGTPDIWSFVALASSTEFAAA